MRDPKLLIGTDDYIFDIDIVDGQPVLFNIPTQSTDQRASISAVIAQGSIPGLLNVGVQWSDYYQQKTTDGYVKIDNQMRQNVENYGKSQVEETGIRTFTPVAMLDEHGSLTVNVLVQGGTTDA